MATISVTRLRLRSVRFFPVFLWHAFRSFTQARRAPGNRDAATRRIQGAFWTMTLWDDEKAVRAFVNTDPHRKAMPRLMHWCDEASVVNWQADTSVLPTWDVAAQRLAAEGRISRVRFPSPAQAAGKTSGS
jgi:hypothetical protein